MMDALDKLDWIVMVWAFGALGIVMMLTAFLSDAPQKLQSRVWAVTLGLWTLGNVVWIFVVGLRRENG